MRIGELAARTGVSTRSLRYYEQQGLLVSARSATGQRHYEEDHVDRVRIIQAYLTAGVPSRTIAEMVPCMNSPSLREPGAQPRSWTANDSDCRSPSTI